MGYGHFIYFIEVVGQYHGSDLHVQSWLKRQP